MKNQSPVNKTVSRIESLTSLRFFAAVHVMLFHEAQCLFRGPSSYIGSSPALNGWLGHGICGTLAAGLLELGMNGPWSVSFFFVLSGFILMYSYQDKFVSGRFTNRAFWTARLARIYPVYILGLALVLPYVVWSGWEGTQSWPVIIRSGVLSVTLLQAWVPQDALSWNGPGWSLSAEAFFYLAFPILLLLVMRNRRWVAAVGAIVFFLMTKLLVAWLYHYLQNPVSIFRQDLFLALCPALRLSEFILGMIVGMFFLSSRQRWNNSFSGHTVPVLAGILCLSLLAYGQEIIGGMLLTVIQPLAFAGLIYAVSMGGVLEKLLSASVLVTLGEASYAIYILHVPIAKYFHSELHWTSGAALDAKMPVLPAMLYCLTVIVVSVIVFKLLETPARRWIKRRLEDPRAAGAS